jgi:hypothetical protein
MEDQPLHRRRRHDDAEGRQRSLRRPVPRVREDHPRDALGTFERNRHSDWAAPVLAHDHEPIQIEVVDKLPDHLRVFCGRVALA